MNYKEIMKKILYCQYRGQRLFRVISGKDFKKKWYERKFKNLDLAFTDKYLYSLRRKDTIIDVFDLPLSSICRKITIGITKEGLCLIPKCSCGKDFILLTFIKRIEETYPIWFCPKCSELRKYRPSTLYYDSSLKLSEKEVSQLKEILGKLRTEIVLETEREKEKDLEDFIVLIDEDE